MRNPDHPKPLPFRQAADLISRSYVSRKGPGIPWTDLLTGDDLAAARSMDEVLAILQENLGGDVLAAHNFALRALSEYCEISQYSDQDTGEPSE